MGIANVKSGKPAAASEDDGYAILKSLSALITVAEDKETPDSLRTDLTKLIKGSMAALKQPTDTATKAASRGLVGQDGDDDESDDGEYYRDQHGNSYYRDASGVAHQITKAQKDAARIEGSYRGPDGNQYKRNGLGIPVRVD